MEQRLRRRPSPRRRTPARAAHCSAPWAQHDVRLHHTGTKTFHHPAVGELILDYESMDLHADPGLNLTVCTAAPGTPAHDALRLLASWAATHEAATQENERSPR